MRKMTEDNLKAAFAGESQAHLRYLIFADKAEKEGRPNIARLFKAIAYAEQVHATNHYNALAMVRSSGENLQIAIDGETFEVEEMYPAYLAVAEIQKEGGAQRSFHGALEAEKIHAGLYHRARQAVDRGEDLALGDVYICEVCGYTGEGEAPQRCPICNAPRDKFKIF
jgi:rubrerythrin